MKHIAIIGTVGVPAQYGGFETLVENLIGKNTTSDIIYTVYCSGKSYSQRLTDYRGALLEYIPLRANGSQSIPYDIFSLIKATRKNDVILILGVSGCAFLPLYRLFSKKRLIINIDGLEHRRNKWGKFARRFLKYSEEMAVRYADTIISDNKAIQDYVRKEYGKPSILIAYGGDHVLCDVTAVEEDVLREYDLNNKEYSFSVCRIEPENNVHIVLEAFKQSGREIVFVGNWERSQYGKELYDRYNQCSNLHLLYPIYDLKILNVLRSHCLFYIHGHSAGGTNPSLVEAMFFRKPILAFDVVYNRETTENKAAYFRNVKDLIDNLQQPNSTYTANANNMLEIAERRYRWGIIAKQYEALY